MIDGDASDSEEALTFGNELDRGIDEEIPYSIPQISEDGEQVSEKGISMAEKEEISRAAFRTWFRIKPGHKEIKDNWWALYYRKILPQFQIPDNHLGRKINNWIEEDFEEYLKQNYHQNEEIQNQNLLKSLKRGEYSVKEGGVPAYHHLELIQPPKMIGSSNQVIPNHILKAASCCINGDIYWTPHSLSQDISWFKLNRESIMKEISLSKSKKNGTEDLPINSPIKSKITRSIAPSSAKEIQVNCNAPWIFWDVLKLNDSFVVMLDIPGSAPNQDFLVHTNDLSKIVIKGRRRSDIERDAGLEIKEVMIQREMGTFEVDILLSPLVADFSKLEQSYKAGTLILKIPVWMEDQSTSASFSNILE